MPVDLEERARSAPRGAAARELPACDLVMKGGITSGVVYPGAVVALAQSHRFEKIGGSSAGAIAAGVCAAAEYARCGDGDRGGMPALAAVTRDLRTQGLLLSLFQPTPETADAFAIATTAGLGDGDVRRRLRRAWLRTLRSEPFAAVLMVVALGLVAAGVAAAFAELPPWAAVAIGVGLGLPLAGGVLAGAGLATLVLVARRTRDALRRQGFGLCPGTRREGSGPALVEWLDAHLQACAGLPPDRPLTLADLASRGVALETLTTDLTAGRPVRCSTELSRYAFRPREWRELFPAHVVDHLVRAGRRLGGAGDPGGEELVQLPAGELPVLIAVRLSLSFPGLLSAVPVHDPPPAVAGTGRHLMSDGGIASNFPVHFFDAWFPRHPTFGLDLAEHPGGGADDVFMAEPEAPPLPRFREVADVGPFARQLRYAMQNWRDALQAELPGFRDRVCQVRLHAREGGLQLDMDAATIEELMQRGYRAGIELAEALPQRPRSPAWVRHCLIRFLAVADAQQRGVHRMRADERLGWFVDELRAGLPALAALERPTSYLEGRPSDWPVRAAEGIEPYLALADRWGPAPAAIDFDGTRWLVPLPAMRLVPDV
jgi:predicted acylesterase/phospholipase RssA